MSRGSNPAPAIRMIHSEKARRSPPPQGGGLFARVMAWRQGPPASRSGILQAGNPAATYQIYRVTDELCVNTLAARQSAIHIDRTAVVTWPTDPNKGGGLSTS